MLIDNCLPVGLRHSIEGHDVETAAFRGWGQLKNGELIRPAGRPGEVHRLGGDGNQAVTGE